MRGEPREVLICENRLFVYAYFISNEMRSICELWIVSVCVGGRRHMSEIERHRFVLQLVRTHSAQYLIWFIGLTQSSRRRLLRCTHCRRPSCCYRHTMLPSSERYAYPLVVNWISSETVGQSMCRSMFGNWRCSHFIKIRQILASLRRTEGTWILLIFPKFCFNFWFFLVHRRRSGNSFEVQFQSSLNMILPFNFLRVSAAQNKKKTDSNFFDFEQDDLCARDGIVRRSVLTAHKFQVFLSAFDRLSFLRTQHNSMPSVALSNWRSLVRLALAAWRSRRNCDSKTESLVRWHFEFNSSFDAYFSRVNAKGLTKRTVMPFDAFQRLFMFASSLNKTENVRCNLWREKKSGQKTMDERSQWTLECRIRLTSGPFQLFYLCRMNNCKLCMHVRSMSVRHFHFFFAFFRFVDESADGKRKQKKKNYAKWKRFRVSCANDAT